MHRSVDRFDRSHTRGPVLDALRLTAAGLAALAAVAAGLMVLLLLALQITPVRLALAGQVLGSLAEGDGVTIAIEGYGGLWPVRLTAERLVVRDDGALLAEVADLSVAWRPLALLGGEVHVTSLSARTVTVYPLPDDIEPETEMRPGPLVPQLPVAVRLDAASLPSITLAPGLAGADIVKLEANARATLQGGDTSLQLEVRRTDGGRFALRLNAALPRDEAPQLDLDLKDGAAGGAGLIAALVGDQALGGLSLTADAKGTRQDWRLSLNGRAGAYGDIAVSANGGLGGDARLITSVRFSPGDGLDGVQPVALTGGLAVTDGTFTFTDADLTYGAVAYAGRLVVEDPLAAPRLALKGVVSNASSLAGIDLPDTLGLALDADSDAAFSRIDFATLSIAGPGLSLEGEGVVDLFAGSAAGELDVALTSKDLLPRPGELTARFDLDDVQFTGAASGRIDARFAPVRGADGEPDALFGELVTVGGRFEADDASATRIETLTITPASGAFDVAVSGRLSQSNSDLSVMAEAGDLSLFSDLAGLSLEGATRADLSLKGPIGAPRLAGDVRLETLRFNQVTLDGNLNINALTEPRVASDISFDGRLEGEALKLVASLGQQGDGLAVDDMTASLPGVTLSGGAVIRDGGAIVADISGDIASLEAVGRIAGQPLKGRGAVKFTSTPDGSGNLMALDADLKRLQVGGAWIGGAKLTAQMSGDETLSAKARIRSVAASDVEVNAIDVSASGSLDDFAVNAKVAGLVPYDGADEDGQLTAAARVTLPASKVVISELEGRLARVPLSLEAPLTVRFAQGIAVEGLDLRVARGRVTGDAMQRTGTLNVDVVLADMPLSLLPRVTGTDTGLRGSLDGKAAISATGAKGAGTLSLKVVPIVPGAQVPPPVITVDGTWDGKTVSANLQADMPGTDDLVGQARVPLVARGGMPVLDDKKSVSARLNGTLDLGAVWPMVPVDGHRMAGLMSVDVTAEGPMADMDIDGQARLEGGLYENFDTGLLLSPLNVTLQGTGTGGTVAVEARDGGTGRLSGSGRLDLTDTADNRLDVSMEMTRFRAARRDEITAIASGTVNVLWLRGADGVSEPLTIGGDVTVDQLDARIPDKLASDVPVIEVTKVTQDGVPVDPVARDADDKDEAGGPPAIVLDVSVDMPRRGFVRGRGLDSEWGGSLKASGPADKPVLVGKFEVLRGTFDFLGRSFDLQGGTIEFTGGQEIDPYLNVKAVYSDDDFQATVAVTGLSSDPDIALSSVPSMPRDEILSRVLFGTGTGQLTALQAVQLADAAANLAGASTGGGVLDTMRRALGVDVLSFGDGGVEVGSYVRDGVYVGVAQGLEAGSGQVNVEVELTDDISLDSGVGTTGDTTVGVTWERDY